MKITEATLTAKNGQCIEKCESFPNCKPCGEIEASVKRQRAIADRIVSRIKKQQ